MTNEDKYKVYCLKDKTSVVYIGYTKRSLHNRWRSHKNVYSDRSNLSIELIIEVDSKEQAKTLEVMFQKQYDTFLPKGLNVAVGHTNNDGKSLRVAGQPTRFGNRPKYPGEEQSRLRGLRRAIAQTRKPVVCVNTGIIYESINRCAKELNLSAGNLSLVLKGERPHTKGLKFEFVRCPTKTTSD